jgi:hypothetical protein
MYIYKVKKLIFLPFWEKDDPKELEGMVLSVPFFPKKVRKSKF